MHHGGNNARKKGGDYRSGDARRSKRAASVRRRGTMIQHRGGFQKEPIGRGVNESHEN